MSRDTGDAHRWCRRVPWSVPPDAAPASGALTHSMRVAMDETRERRHAGIVRDALQRAAEHLPRGHPAEPALRRALCAAEAHARALGAMSTGEDHVLATRWRRSPAGERPPDLAPPQS